MSSKGPKHYVDEQSDMLNAVPISIAEELLSELKTVESATQALALIRSIRLELELLEDHHVDRARARGCSWEGVAYSLGVTRQGAWKKHAAREI